MRSARYSIRIRKRREFTAIPSRRKDFRAADAGKLKLVIGRAAFTSEITLETGRAGIRRAAFRRPQPSWRRARNGDATRIMRSSSPKPWRLFRGPIFPEVIRAFDRGFGTDTYSLKSLFRDEQRNILSQILISTLDEAEAVYRQLYEHHAPLMRFLSDLKTPLPKAFRTTAEYALNSHLRRAFSEDLDIGANSQPA